jgi:putative heme iron utilization protein
MAGTSDFAAPPPGTTIRQLLRSEARAALGTLDKTGAPYVSLVMLAVDHDAAPLLLLSDLADHTQNFKRDPRVSLLVDGTAGMAAPLAGARATLMGRIEPAAAAHQAGRYLARHPDAQGFIGFADFNLYRMAVERAHLVAGFGRIHWVEASAVLWPAAAALPLAGREADIVAHMNEDHADAVALYATRLLGQPADEWRLTGVDPEGADLAAPRRRCRLWFDKPVHDAEAARVELVRLVKRARQTDAAAGTGDGAADG